MAGMVIVEKALSYLIMQAAYEVHNRLDPGFPEGTYEEAMRRELTSGGVKVERQKGTVVRFKGEPIGEFVLDTVVNERVILEYKAITEIAKIHEQQALSYLKATGLELAIVINFGADRVLSSRVVNTTGKAKPSPRVPKPENLAGTSK